MADQDQSPFALEEPAWLKDVPRPQRPIGDAVLPSVDAAVEGLSAALCGLQERIVCEVKNGCSLDTAGRLLAAYQHLAGLDRAEDRLRTILYDRGVAFEVLEADCPF